MIVSNRNGRHGASIPRRPAAMSRMETAMSTHPVTSRNPKQHHAMSRKRKTGALVSPSDLIAVAGQSSIDACDVACEAMPALLVNDLPPQDVTWVLEHTNRCGYCHDMLTRYHHVDAALNRLMRAIEGDQPVPPPLRFFTKRGRRASYARIDSPVGPLFIAVSDRGVCEIGFGANETEEGFRNQLQRRGFSPAADRRGVEGIAQQLFEYFRGERNRFEVPLDFSGVSPFTHAVLAATSEVPFGRLATYRDIAQRIGRPEAMRAVGNALGRNPIPIIVPCHRIVRSDASLGGYTGGIEIKQRLLAHEGVILPQESGSPPPRTSHSTS